MSNAPDSGMENIQTEDVSLYFTYDIHNPPAKPSNNGQWKWTRFVCISDTHCNRFKVPDGDVLLHAGDLTHTGRLKQMLTTTNWLKSLRHPHKLIIAGNHDLTLDHDWYLTDGKAWHINRGPPEDPEAVRQLLNPEPDDITFEYLQYQSTEFTHEGTDWKAYGSPGSPWFGGWAFNYDRGTEAEDLAKNIPDDVDILLTHGPPHRILDRVYAGELVGCKALASRVEEIRPIIHIFGHIHEARGAIVHYWPEETNQDQGESSQQAFINSNKVQRKFTIYVNASVQPTYRYQDHLVGGTNGAHYPAIIIDVRHT